MKKIFSSVIQASFFLLACACLSLPALAVETFTNPIIPPSSADPFVVQYEGYYYHIQRIGGQDSPGIAIRKTADFTQLGEVKPVWVWAAPESGPYSREIWAPELHFYNGKWYIYVAADAGKNEDHQMWVIESEGSDPMGPYDQAPHHLETGGWAIDGTFLTDAENNPYFIWSGWPGKVDGVQNLYIAPMESPIRITAERTLLSTPDQVWEQRSDHLRGLQEGPQILRHGDKLFIVYSASGSWNPHYCLGMLEYKGGDFCNPANWKKHEAAPVFEGKGKVYGVGHCSFVKSPDGMQDWIVYHIKSKTENGWGDRCVQTQSFAYSEEGLPVFGEPVQPGVALPKPSGKISVQSPVRDEYSDTWVATDNLARSLPIYEDVGAPQPNRSIGMFYFLWMGAHGDNGPFDVSKILAQYPDAMQNPDHPAWGKLYEPHHWGESWFGYYRSTDEAVYEKHARMLGNMGVDVIIFDNSNKVTYFDQYMALCRAFTRVRECGGRTPQIAFLCPFWDPATTVTKLWNEFYSKNLYPDLWYRWEGKPLIMADLEACGTGVAYGEKSIPATLGFGETLGQSFRLQKPAYAISAATPTWNSTNSAATLTLRHEDPHGELVSQKRFTQITDNGWLMLTLEKPIPAGTYYLELSEPEGKVGWWSENGNPVPDGKAWENGKVVSGSRNLRFKEGGEADMNIANFFTFRKPQPDYFVGPTGPNQWGWLEVSPQHVFYDENKQPEQMTVGVAQNALDGKLSVLSNPRSHGRSFHDGKEPGPEGRDTTGLNFQEQWNRALEVNPPFIFITGWNEWIMGRFNEHASFYGVDKVCFVDQFNDEYSRDIEPANCAHQDNYYYQAIANIRKYKGVRKPEPVVSKPISIDGVFADWKEVAPEFRDDMGDPVHRDYPGYGKIGIYVNQTGRNDIILAKMSLGSGKLFCYVQTREPMRHPGQPHWMMLFLDTDRNPTNGWFGYDFKVCSDSKNPAEQVVLQKFIPAASEKTKPRAGEWKTIATLARKINGPQMELAIPLESLFAGDSVPAYIDFKWADNIQETGEPSDFTINGDAAPNDRYNYRAIFQGR